jgi:Uma2 family endonuclease
MALSTHRWTRADLDRLPEDDGNRYEIIDGELLVTPAPRPAHEIIIQELGWLLDVYCRRLDIGRAYHGKSAVVTDTSHVEPDIVVRQRVVPAPSTWDEMPLPRLVVEVLSDSTRRYDLVKKRAFYMKTGAPQYWIVDGETRTVRIITRDGESLVSDRLAWQPAPAHPAFEVDLRSFFASALG